MDETLKRAISGAIYIFLLLASILYSTESFLILFGIFLIISLFEFCNLIKVNKLIPIITGASIYLFITFFSNYDRSKNVDIPTLDNILLATTLLISIKCIFFLFDPQYQQSLSINHNSDLLIMDDLLVSLFCSSNYKLHLWRTFCEEIQKPYHFL